MPAFIDYQQAGSVVTLTMNEPERRNPLTGNAAVADFLAVIRAASMPTAACAR